MHNIIMEGSDKERKIYGDMVRDGIAPALFACDFLNTIKYNNTLPTHYLKTTPIPPWNYRGNATILESFHDFCHASQEVPMTFGIASRWSITDRLIGWTHELHIRIGAFLSCVDASKASASRSGRIVSRIMFIIVSLRGFDGCRQRRGLRSQRPAALRSRFDRFPRS